MKWKLPPRIKVYEAMGEDETTVVHEIERILHRLTELNLDRLSDGLRPPKGY